MYHLHQSRIEAESSIAAPAYDGRPRRQQCHHQSSTPSGGRNGKERAKESAAKVTEYCRDWLREKITNTVEKVRIWLEKRKSKRIQNNRG